jgi:hypothetical protein
MNKIFWLFSLETQGSWSGSSHPRSSIDEALAAGAKPGDWEIDRRLLKIGESIAAGSSGDLWVGFFRFNYFSSSLFFGCRLFLICYLLIIWRYRGVYFGQDVAIKIFRSEQLNDTQEEEFAQEVAILRWIGGNCNIEVHFVPFKLILAKYII